MTIITTFSRSTNNKSETKKKMIENIEQSPETWMLQRSNFNVANMAFHAALSSAVIKHYYLMKFVPAVRPLYIIISAN